MIEVEFGKKILNVLFDTSGTVGLTPDEEKTQLESEGVVWGVLPFMYKAAYETDNYQIPGPRYNTLNEYKRKIDNSINWETYRDTTENDFGVPHDGPIKYTIEKPNEKDPSKPIIEEKTFTGWSVRLKGTTGKDGEEVRQIHKYPAYAYLALFTEMPDKFGDNYKEPIEDSEGNLTTYMRANLHEDIVLGSESLSNAVADETTGISTLLNKSMIMFPEISGISWGTIVGIGIFETDTAGEGRPIYWGRLKPAMDAIEEHVPLFRIGDFKLTLS